MPKIVSAVGTAAGAGAAFGIGQRLRYVKPPKGHRIYKLVGKIASDWTHFEHELDRIIWCPTPTISSIPVCITAQLIGPMPRFRALIALLTLRSVSQPVFTKYIKEANTFSGQIGGVAEARNRIVHDPWYYDKASGTVAQFKSMPASDRGYGIRERDILGVEQTLRDIAKHTKTAEKLFKRLNRDVSTLLKKSTPRRVSFPHQ
jgi:hypothetical protein